MKCCLKTLEWILGYYDEVNGNPVYIAICLRCGHYHYTQNHNDVYGHLTDLNLTGRERK